MEKIEINQDNMCEYYFNKYWAFTNPQVFSSNELRLTLLNVWNEIWAFFECDTSRPEGWLGFVGKAYEKRIKLGKKKFYEKYDTTGSRTQKEN